ncbi:NADH-dependent alcohol dehydrogenase [Bacteroidia bacterium]|nr:NADH-dependent alcohol dehydrogenase [Bacteroidia bacterium]
MKNFTFQNTTKLIFGKGTIAKLSTEIPADKKILVTFGGGSVKTNGVYDQVKNALKNHNTIEFWGIEPNPDIATLRKAIELGKKENVDFLLSVGGGSTLDGTKLIAAAIPSLYDGWDLVTGEKPIEKVLPIASVMTLPATGSEMNKNAVISNREIKEKYSLAIENPIFSILDPETTFSLPDYQIANGIADTFVHVMEQYLTTKDASPLMDRWAESILQTLVEVAPKIKENKHDYDNMSTFMLCATMALNNIISMGVVQDWSTHQIGHELTALHGVTHGESLAIVLPAVMKQLRQQKLEKILQYGKRVWNINEHDTDIATENAIVATESFFRSLGLATRLSDLKIGEATINEISNRFSERNTIMGEANNIDGKIVKQILTLAL